MSRDLRELRLARIPSPQGSRYASPDALSDDHRTALEDVLPQFFESSDGVGELLVVKTIAGGAQPIAEAIDALERDHAFLTQGGVFTDDLIQTWIGYKRENELDPIRLRPHPYEFHLYYDN